jgi:protein ImuB
MRLQLCPPGPVSKATLAATLTAPLENRQQELFAGNREEAERQFSLLIDRLCSRLGPEAVVRPRLTADPVPERAVAYEPLLEAERRRQRPRQYPQFAHRPALLCSPPLPLRVVSVVPDGPPVSFLFEGRTNKVAHWSGPERIESGWWRGPSVRRDYYRVEIESGQRYWLYRQLADGKWFLHGEFA